MTNKLCVLNYHGIENSKREFLWRSEENSYVLAKETLELHFEKLQTDGFRPLSLNELAGWLNRQTREEKEVLLTFDDGHLSHYRHVLPLLRKINFKGAFFIPTGFVGKKDHMNWNQLKELAKEGFDIGSHGHRHVPLTRLSERELETELELSKKMLEDRLGIEVKSFSVPLGFFDPRIKKAAKQARYRFVFTSQFDLNRRGEDSYSLRRIAVTQEISMDRLNELIHGELGIQRYSEKLKNLARRFISPTIYSSLAELKGRL